MCERIRADVVFAIRSTWMAPYGIEVFSNPVILPPHFGVGDVLPYFGTTRSTWHGPRINVQNLLRKPSHITRSRVPA